MQELRNLEHPFDYGSLGSGTHKIRICTPAEQEIDRINDNRLPGAGFTGDDVEASSKWTSRRSIMAKFSIRISHSISYFP